MAFTRPTLAQIRDRVESDFKAVLSLPVILRRSFAKVFSAVVAGASHTLHGHLQDFIQVQFFPDTADEEFLVRWANVFGVTRLDATFAEINITITGVASTVVPIGTAFQRSDGFEYTTQAEVTIGGGGSIPAILVASEAGDNGNIDDGSTVNITSPITGVDSTATVDSTLLEGDDQETIEALRTRLLERIQAPPAGGTVTDFIAFAKTVVGVTRVWILPNFLGQGTVGVTFVEDEEVPIIPSVAKVAEVQAALLEKEPQGTGGSTAFAQVANAIDPFISIKPNTLAVRDAITAELEDLIFREAQVRGAIDPENVSVPIIFDGKIPLSRINEAISIADGEEDHVLTSPTIDAQPGDDGGLLTLGTITFSTLV